jgi:hypothetical protein
MTKYERAREAYERWCAASVQPDHSRAWYVLSDDEKRRWYAVVGEEWCLKAR